MVIWKFVLEPGGTTLNLPSGAQVLSVGLQRDAVCMWALVDPEVRKVTRRFESYGTRHEIKDVHELRFIGTTQDLNGSPLVFHHFERVSNDGAPGTGGYFSMRD